MKIKYFGIGTALFLLSILSYSVSSASANSTFNSDKIMQLANHDRQYLGLAALKVNPALTLAADLKLDDMIANNYFDHVSPQGTSPWHFVQKAGYAYTAAGENLAMNFSDPEKVEAAWMNSPEHRENILNPKFSEIGVAQKEVVYKGQRTNFIVEYFGDPETLAVQPSAN